MEKMIWIIIAALLSGFAKLFFDAFFPDKEKNKAFIIKAFNILLSFLLPIGYLANLFLEDSLIDKSFIFKVLLMSLILISNILVELFTLYNRRNRKELIEAIVVTVNQLTSLHAKHVDLTTTSVDANIHIRDKTMDLISDISKRVTALERKRH